MKLVMIVMKRHDLELGLQVDLVVELRLDPALRLLLVPAYHNERCLDGSGHRQDQIQDELRIGAKAHLAGHQSCAQQRPCSEEDAAFADQEPRPAPFGDVVAKMLAERHPRIIVLAGIARREPPLGNVHDRGSGSRLDARRCFRDIHGQGADVFVRDGVLQQVSRRTGHSAVRAARFRREEARSLRRAGAA